MAAAKQTKTRYGSIGYIVIKQYFNMNTSVTLFAVMINDTVQFIPVISEIFKIYIRRY